MTNLINFELLNQFLHERLRYKDSVEILAWKISNNFIYLILEGLTEPVKIEVYMNWINQKRDRMIDKILISD